MLRKGMIWMPMDKKDQLAELISNAETSFYNGQLQEAFSLSLSAIKLDENNAIKNGATSVLEPELEPWGQRTCYIADPEGNLIEIGSWNKVYEQKDL